MTNSVDPDQTAPDEALFLHSAQTCLSIRPKIKFYLFAIAYLPTRLLPTQLFFLLFQK